MNEMILSSRHRIRNSNPEGLRPSTPPLGQIMHVHIYFSHKCEIGKGRINKWVDKDINNYIRDDLYLL